jgi:pyroglutamyl-peptidase
MAIEPTIVLTGFEPFDGDSINPAGEIVRALDGEFIAGHRIAGAILPVAFSPALPMLEALLLERQPVLVLALGQAGGRSELSLERVAINLIDARIPDNEGLQPIDTAVVEGAPQARFSTLPLKAIERRLRTLGIPVALSLSAGSFVCNQVFFGLADLLATRHRGCRGGFMHVPWLPQQAARHPGQPSMALETMLTGVRAALDCALATVADDHRPGGATH